MLSLILWSVAFFIGLFIIYHFFKGAFKIVFYVLSILTLATLIFSVFLIIDAQEFKERMANEPNLFLLKSNGEIISGMQIHNIAVFDATFLDSANLATINDLYKQKKYDLLKTDKFKVFVLSKDVVSDLETVELNDKSYPLNQILPLFDSEKPLSDFLLLDFAGQIDPISESDQMETLVQEVMGTLRIHDQTQFKSYLFALLLGEKMRNKGSLFIINEYRKGTIEIHKETTLFWFIKKIPKSLFESVENTALRIKTN